jgi:hypothetical protein
MNVRSAFTDFISSSAAGAKPAPQTIECPANSPAEEQLPTVARAMADHFDFINEPGHSPSEINQAKAKMSAVVDQYPEAFETLSTVSDQVVPESVTVGYEEGPQPGMFRLDVHEFGLFNSPPTICGERTGTLFIDTTPGQDGIEAAFVPLARQRS